MTAFLDLIAFLDTERQRERERERERVKTEKKEGKKTISQNFAKKKFCLETSSFVKSFSFSRAQYQIKHSFDKLIKQHA